MKPAFFMSSPKFFRVEYVTNVWMKGMKKVQLPKARSQWAKVKKALKKHGKVFVLKTKPNLPDQVFAANVGIINGRTFLASNFRYPQRREESYWAQQWFKTHKYKVVRIPEKTKFEGMGDTIFIDNKTVALGYGFRSSKQAKKHVEKTGIKVDLHLNLVDARFYHLDTCFVVLPGKVALYYPKAFSRTSQKAIKNYFTKRIPVLSKDALHFVCNGVPVGNIYVTCKLSSQLKNKLKMHGIKPLELDMSEFLKSGGAVRCIVLDLIH